MCLEHGISPDGILEPFVSDGKDRKDVFFYQVKKQKALKILGRRRALHPACRSPRSRAKSHQQHPRFALRKPLQPREHLSIEGRRRRRKQLGIRLCARRACQRRHWRDARQVHHTINSINNREAENSDSLEGFMLLHSIAGGTGSGLGSYVKLKNKINHSRYSKC